MHIIHIISKMIFIANIGHISKEAYLIQMSEQGTIAKKGLTN